MYQTEEMPDDVEDSEYITKNLIETVTLLCRNNLRYNHELKIQGLLAVTTDYQNVIVIQINEILPKKSVSGVQPHHMSQAPPMMEPCPVNQNMGGSVPVTSGFSRGGRMASRVGRMPRRGGGMLRMRAAAPGLSSGMSHQAGNPRGRVRLQFTPQKRPQAPMHQGSPGYPPMMRSPVTGGIRMSPQQPRTPQHHFQQHQQEMMAEEVDQSAMVPYNNPTAVRRTPVRRCAVRQPKVEPEESNEMEMEVKQVSHPVAIKREFGGGKNKIGSDVCVLSDEEDFGPPRLKCEMRQQQSGMPSEVVNDDSNPMLHRSLDNIVQESLRVALDKGDEMSSSPMKKVQQHPVIKSESVPSVQIETVKDEVDWPATERWTAAPEQQQQQQQHFCSLCGSVFHCLRFLRQHMRAVHNPGSSRMAAESDGSVGVNSNVVAVLLDNNHVVSSPASSSTTVMMQQQPGSSGVIGDDDDDVM